ncbi:MAG: (5-formylfuran-3-yl)methyl phosphate synthase [Pirellulaceae bacterium]
MPRLLISVRSTAEARDALAGGADLIDIKEPERGALGVAHQTVWNDVCRVVQRRRPVSIALGELLEHAPLCVSAYPPDVQFAKIGLAGCARREDWAALWSRAMETLPVGVAPVAVLYADAMAADAPTPQEVLRQALILGCHTVLVDTYDKTAGGLFEVIPERQLWAIVDRARRHGLTVVLGGSLNERSMIQALRLSPDFVAFRGAVCRGSRTGSVDRVLVRALAKQLASD